MDDKYNIAVELYNNEEYTKAFNIFYSLAEDGDIQSQKDVANMLLHGIGVQENEKSAYKWYKSTADLGDEISQHLISGCYIHGLYGFEINYKKGFEYLEKSSNQNYAPAKHDLAIMYFNGNGINIDKEKAKSILEENCEVAYKSSLKLLAAYYLQNKYGFLNIFKGIKYAYRLSKIVNQNDFDKY